MSSEAISTHDAETERVSEHSLMSQSKYITQSRHFTDDSLQSIPMLHCTTGEQQTRVDANHWPQRAKFAYFDYSHGPRVL